MDIMPPNEEVSSSFGELRYNSEKYGKSFLDSLTRPGTIECIGDPTAVVVFIRTCKPVDKQEARGNIARYGVWFGQGSHNKNGFEIGRAGMKHYAWNTSARLMGTLVALQTVKEEILQLGAISQIVVVNALEHFTLAAAERVPATLYYLKKHKNPSFIKDCAEQWQELFDEIKALREMGIRVVFHTDLGGPDPNIFAAESLAMSSLKNKDDTETIGSDMSIDGMEVIEAMKDYLEPLQDDNWAEVNVPDWREDFMGDMAFLKEYFPELN
jgi:hypothetical protein